MTIETLIPYITAALPSIIAFITAIATIIKGLKEFKLMHKEVMDTKVFEDLRDEMKQVVKENYELKRTLNETMTKIDHIERK